MHTGGGVRIFDYVMIKFTFTGRRVQRICEDHMVSEGNGGGIGRGQERGDYKKLTVSEGESLEYYIAY